MDREDACEILGALHPLLARDNQRLRFDELVAARRQKQLAGYEESETRCLELSINNLAAQGQSDELTAPVKGLAALGSKDVDSLRRLG